ncbi:general transcription factor IIIA, b [Gadus morhua]|uniref:General transcription factor IIIA, b n=1 Tax=Gadus morhua TaxID=8049 RepID=A0A8C4ZLN7_GADMO|nr:transcription factor IIIA [Gadus morhua]
MGERIHIKKSFICSFHDCSASFSKSWKLEAHNCKHTGLKPFSCDDCDKNFCTRYQLTRHQLNHSGDRPHKCQADGCGEAFVSQSSMKNHMDKSHHNEGKPFKCNHQGCGKDFSKRYQLKAHVYEHTKVLPFHCTVTGCTREFPSRGSLDHHKKVHQGYPCEEDGCPFQGKTWSAYQTHKKEHRVKLPCDKCKKQFNNGRFLLLHKRHVHLGVKKELACPHKCGKSFTRQFHLESHVLLEHEGVRAFGCAFPGCGKRFAMKESLWRHGVVHDPKRKTNLRPKTPQPGGDTAPLKAKPTSAEGCMLAAKLERTKMADS